MKRIELISLIAKRDQIKEALADYDEGIPRTFDSGYFNNLDRVDTHPTMFPNIQSSPELAEHFRKASEPLEQFYRAILELCERLEEEQKNVDEQIESAIDELKYLLE